MKKKHLTVAVITTMVFSTLLSNDVIAQETILKTETENLTGPNSLTNPEPTGATKTKAEAAIAATAPPGQATFTIQIVAGPQKAGSKARQYVTVVHKFISEANAPALNVGNNGEFYESADINRNLNAQGNPALDDAIEITKGDGTGPLQVNRAYFPDDDPATGPNEENFIPYQVDGVNVKYYDEDVNPNIPFADADMDMSDLVGHTGPNKLYHPQNAPNATKGKLPKGFVEMEIRLSNNRANREVRYKFTGGVDAQGNNLGVCAVDITLTEETSVNIREVQGNSGVVVPGVEPKKGTISLNYEKDWCKPELKEEQQGASLNPNSGYFFVSHAVPGVEDVALRFVEMYNPANSVEIAKGFYDTSFYRPDFYLFNNTYYLCDSRVKIGGEWRGYGPQYSIFTDDMYGARVMRPLGNADNRVNYSIYPNPTENDGFNVNVSDLLEEESFVVIKVYDLSGKHILKKSESIHGTDGIIKVETGSDLSPGIYMVHVEVNSQIFKEKLQVR